MRTLKSKVTGGDLVMPQYHIGFTFTDNLWDGGTGEIVGIDQRDRWVVRWNKGEPEYSTESNESIAEMVKEYGSAQSE